MLNKDNMPFNYEIIPTELLNLMSELVKTYISRYKLWKKDSNKDELKSINEIINNFETKILDYNYLPLKKTMNEFNLSDDEKRMFIILFVFNTDDLILNDCHELITNKKRRFSTELSPLLIIELLFETYSERIKNRQLFSTNSGLVRNNIIKLISVDSENILNWIIETNFRFLNYILGDNNIYASNDYIRIEKSNVSIDSVIIDDYIKKDIFEALDNYDEYQKKIKKLTKQGIFEYGYGYTFMFYGQSGVGKTMLAHAIANYLNKKIITYNSDNRYEYGPRRRNSCFNENIERIFLEAELHNGVLFFDECSELFKKDRPESRELLIQIEKSNVIVIFATNSIIDLSPALERRILFKYKIKTPSVNQRILLWKQFLTKSGITSIKDDVINDLSERYNMPGGFIKNAALKYINSKISGTINGDELEKIASVYYNRYIESSFVLKQIVPSKFNPQEFEFLVDKTKNSLDKIIETALFLYSISHNQNECIPSINVVIASEDEWTANKTAEYILNKLQRAYIKLTSNYNTINDTESYNEMKYIIDYLQADAIEDIIDSKPVIIFNQFNADEEKSNTSNKYADCLINLTSKIGILRIILISENSDKRIYKYFNPDFIIKTNESVTTENAIEELFNKNNIHLENELKMRIIINCRKQSRMNQLKKIIEFYKLKKDSKNFKDYIDLMFFNNMETGSPLFG